MINFFIYICIFVYGDFKINFKYLFLALILLVFGFEYFWNFGNEIRGLEIINKEILVILQNIISRLGASLDNFTIIVNNKGYLNQDLLNGTINTFDSIKRIVNQVAIGDVFNIELDSPGAMFKYIYLDAHQHSHGDQWSGFGWSYAKYGPYIAIPMIFLNFYLLLYFFIRLFISKFLSFILISYFLFYWLVNDYFLNGFTEIFISGIIVSFFHFIMIIILMNFLTSSSKK